MDTFGAFDAKTHFSQLLERVAGGETITITRHGMPVAKLVPVDAAADLQKHHEAVLRLKELRKKHTLGGLDWRSLRDESRR
jgi:prevent-host-death family protein